MKKLVALLLALTFVFSLAACGGGDWEKFIKDYDKWADEYVKVAEAYADNPDENFAKYVEKSNELREWTTEAAGKVEELELDEEEAIEYNRELTQIQQKIIAANQK